MNLENGFFEFQGNHSYSELFTLRKKCSKLSKILYCSFRTASKCLCHIYALALTLSTIVVSHFSGKRKCIGINYTLHHFIYYKMRRSSSQNVTSILLQNGVITKCYNFITTCDSYYNKMLRLLQNASVQRREIGSF